MTEPEHAHHWVLTNVDPTAGGKNARMITVTCNLCQETVQRLTARTDEEIAAEIEAANG